MAISSRERNIVILAGIVAAIFAANTMLPYVQDVYQQRQANIDNIQLDIQRERRLILETRTWRDRRDRTDDLRQEFDRQIFSGSTVPLIEAAIQRELSQKARESGISVSSTRLAERQASMDWLMVSQEMSFRTDSAANTVTFLNKLKTSEPRLRVTEFSVSRTRNQYTGSITVVGFARSEGLTLNLTAAR